MCFSASQVDVASVVDKAMNKGEIINCPEYYSTN